MENPSKIVNGGVVYVDTCLRCDGELVWQDCPTGGWWYHVSHPSDEHDAAAGYCPFEDMNERGEWITPVPAREDYQR
jgi:rubredoxin